MLLDSEYSRKADLRVQKTERALITSMSALLSQYRFTKLTVDKLCREGQLSRATFYSHFSDKYDLLAFWLLSFWPYEAGETDTYEDIKETINQFTNENRKILKNLLIDADLHTLEIVQNYLCSILNIDVKGIGATQKGMVASNLYIGGMVYYLLWQVRSNFPPDVPIINEYSYGAIRKLWDWAKE